MSKRHTLTLLTAFAAILLLEAGGRAQTVLQRARIGGYAEDIEFVSRGTYADHVVMVNGKEVLGIANEGGPNQPLRKLFDLKATAITHSTGIAYIESEKLFVVNDPTQRNKLFVVDDFGRPQGTRTIQYLNGYSPAHLEGLAYIPAGSANFPDHLLMVAWDTFNADANRIEVIRRDGVVVAEIQPPFVGYEGIGMGDVAYLSPNRLLVTFYNEEIWTIDFAGNIVSGPISLTGSGGFEGIVRVRDRVVVAGFPQPLYFFDRDLNRLPGRDRNDVVGLNLNTPHGVAWNSDTGRFLVNAQVALNERVISDISPALDAAQQVADLSADGFPRPRAMSYLPAEHLIAVAHANVPRAILLYRNDGTLDSQINVAGLGLGNLFGLAYIPTTNQFAAVFNNPADPQENRRLRILSRTGALERTIDLACTGARGVSAVEFYNPAHPSGGQFLVVASSNRVLRTDFDGNLLGELNSRTHLGVLTPADITAITTGPQAGAFAMTDSSGGELVVFRLD
jgi:hypothetical protein